MNRPAPRPLPALATALLVALGLAGFWWTSRPYAWPGEAAQETSNRVVAGFQAGHLWMDKAAPPELAAAPDPYRFAAYRRYLEAPWGLTDLSYYRGHLYAYFGVTPVLLLFWPCWLLTHAYLHEAAAVLIFCLLGYGLSLALALGIARRYCPRPGPGAPAAAALLLGSATALPVFLVRPGLYEVAISCGYALVMLALLALWRAWHHPARRLRWTAVASLAYGLAVGARPSLLFGAVILFLPALALWARRRRHPVGKPWRGAFGAALLPLAAVGAGLALYNDLRFGSALQFGHDYQLSGNDVHGARSFDPRFAGDNFRLYFLALPRARAAFPYVWAPAAPALAPGHLPVEFFFGSLVVLPVLWLALAAPFAGGRTGGAGVLRAAAAVLAILFLAAAVPICCYAGATSRYLLDFLPALALLAWLGWLAVAAAPPGPAAAWTLLGISTGFVWLLALALSHFYREGERGLALLAAGRTEEGIAVYRDLSLLDPEFKPKAELTIGTLLLQQGRAEAGAGYLQAAVRDRPTLAAAHFNLGNADLQLGRPAEAAAAFAAAARLDPTDGAAEASEAVALAQLGRRPEAIAHLQAALQLDPGEADYRRALQALGGLPARP